MTWLTSRHQRGAPDGPLWPMSLKIRAAWAHNKAVACLCLELGNEEAARDKFIQWCKQERYPHGVRIWSKLINSWWR